MHMEKKCEIAAKLYELSEKQYKILERQYNMVLEHEASLYDLAEVCFFSSLPKPPF